MGSTFTRYKTPARKLDFAPTFTMELLRKDFELGLDTARQLDVPLPLPALVHSMVVEAIGLGYGDQDFARFWPRKPGPPAGARSRGNRSRRRARMKGD